MSTHAHQLTENSDESSDSRTRSLANLKPFKPGQSGNPGGRPKGLFSRAARKHLRRQIAEGVTQLDAVIDAQVQEAIEKRCTQAATFLRDTVDGKPQADSAGQIQIAIGIEFIA